MWHSFGGYVIIQVQGAGLARFLNAALAAGIRLVEVERPARATLRVTMPARDFLRKLPAVRRRSGCRVQILAREGAAFALLRLRKRKVLLIGAALAAAFLLFGTSRVWRFSIEGADRVPAAVVERALAEAGAEIGMARHDVARIPLARAVNDADPRIAWAGVSLEGITLRVRLVEAEPLPKIAEPEAPQDIVAGWDGVIERITALSGKANVRPGDAVRAGDILIRGDISREGAEEPLLVHAAGEAMAKVWITASVTLPPQTELPVRTGAAAPYRAIRIAGWTIHESIPAFPAYERETEEALLLPGPVLPIRLISGVDHETALGEVRVSKEERIAEAAFRAELLALERVPKSARILEKHVDTAWDAKAGARATAAIAVLMDIGKETPVTIQHAAAPEEE